MILNQSGFVATVKKYMSGKMPSWCVIRMGRLFIGDGTVEDITNSKLTEIELRKLSRDFVEQSPVSIVITDINGNIEYINPRFCEVNRYSRDELKLGKNPRVLSLEKKDGKSTNFCGIQLAGNEWKGELHNKKKNGDLYWESASISPIKMKGRKLHTPWY